MGKVKIKTATDFILELLTWLNPFIEGRIWVCGLRSFKIASEQKVTPITQHF